MDTLHGPTVRRQHHGATEGHGSSRQAQRTAYVCRAADTLDRRTVLRVAGKVPKAMEELRTKTEYQLADDPFSLPQITAQEIVNRLLEDKLSIMPRI